MKVWTLIRILQHGWLYKKGYGVRAGSIFFQDFFWTGLSSKSFKIRPSHHHFIHVAATFFENNENIRALDTLANRNKTDAINISRQNTPFSYGTLEHFWVTILWKNFVNKSSFVLCTYYVLIYIVVSMLQD